MSLEHRLSERQFFALSLLVISLIVGGIYLGFLRPKQLERQRLREEIQSKTRQLQTAGYLLGEASLLRKKQQVEEQVQTTLQEWAVLQEELSGFDNPEELQEADIARIDYKFYLYLTRDRLRKKAEEQEIAVPALLGLPDEIQSNEVARERMLQLRAVEKLVDAALEFELANIRSIDPLPPILHRIDPAREPYMEEYPLRVIFEGPMEGLYNLWVTMFQEGRTMMLRNIAMEKTRLRRPDEVRMTATLSSFLFLDGATELNPVQGKAVQRTGARGH